MSTVSLITVNSSIFVVLHNTSILQNVPKHLLYSTDLVHHLFGI